MQRKVGQVWQLASGNTVELLHNNYLNCWRVRYRSIPNRADVLDPSCQEGSEFTTTLDDSTTVLVKDVVGDPVPKPAHGTVPLLGKWVLKKYRTSAIYVTEAVYDHTSKQVYVKAYYPQGDHRLVAVENLLALFDLEDFD